MTHELHLKVAGTGRYLPSQVVPNSYFAGLPVLYKYNSLGKIVKTYAGQDKISAEKIFEITGMRERRKSLANETLEYMGYKAAVSALEASGLNAESLRGIICATISNAQNIPSLACKIAEKLGVKKVLAFDINSACAGFAQEIIEANAHVLRREGNYLVVASEQLTSIVDPTDINSTLFGDGAGAAVLVPTFASEGIIGEYCSSDSLEGRVGYIFNDQQGYLRMPEGQKVMKHAILNMAEAAKDLKAQVGWNRADVYIPHQANGRIVNALRKSVQQENSVVFENVEKYGNTSSATCAIALDEAIREGIVSPGKKVILVGFGAGLVTAGVALQF